jgi:multidrug efflux pump subunit AcrB
MSLGKFSVSNPVLVNILMVVIFILGFLSISRLPQEQFSEVPFYWVNVIVPYPGVAAEDVEKTVTVPVENEYANLERVSQISSVSSEGLSVVRIEFEDGISDEDFNRLYQKVQTDFSRITLPDGVLDATIDDFSATDFVPVIEVILYGDNDFNSLSSTASLLRDRLLSTPDIAGIDIVGDREKKIFIEVDRVKMDSVGLSVGEVYAAINGANVTVPGGTLQTAQRDFLIRTVSDFQVAEDFAQLLVRNTPTGQIRLKDVAEVYEGFEESGSVARFNGQRSVSLRVNKKTNGDSVGAIEEIKARVAEFQPLLPPGMQLELFNDSTVQIKDSIGTLISNSVMGLLLLVGILWLFLGFRNAAMTALGIPVTFALTFMILEALGETFNSNTLFGLVLVLGLIVDHAIVIIENAYRWRQNGLGKVEAAIKGTNEVVLPVIAATATTVAAFLPLMFLPGIIGRFLRVIPLTVSIALIVSTAEALIFLPSHFSEWSGKLRKKEGSRFEGVQNWFEGVLTWIYQRRRWALGIIALGSIGSFALAPLIQQDLFSSEDITVYYVEIEMPVGTPIEKTDEIVREFESRLLPLAGNGEVVSVNSYVGFTATGSSNVIQSNVGQIIVDVTEAQEGRTRPIITLLQEAEELTKDISGPESVRYRKAQSGPPVTPPITFRIQGDNYNDLQEVSNLLQNRLREDQNLYNIQDDVDLGSPELLVNVNQDLASDYGLTTADVGLFIRQSYEGTVVSSVFRDNSEIDVLVRLAIENRQDPNLFYAMRIPNRQGDLVQFGSVASIPPTTESVASIKRVDGKREVTIEGEAFDRSQVRRVNGQIAAYFEENISSAYPGVELFVGGSFTELGNLIFEILRTLLIGIFLIYTILGAQFKSYTQPLLILITIPFAFVGVFSFLFISGIPFSTTVMYAGVALAGIAVNDSIVLISFINELRASGKGIQEAVIEAAKTRLRPILLTSITTIAGLLPTALGIGGTSVVWGPMASTIIFGLIFSTVTALVIIPCLYGIFAGFGERRRKKKELKNAQKMQTIEA